ncbi:hypothetical protein R1flu_027323 [Riccia fluitans]|uniref:Transcription factor IIIC 90kDa subunit N-terminal domain-containing protein n=1 Tax=Riccia fluitans TaxID=41844 RepID=A0ABD1XIG0_9MARC
MKRFDESEVPPSQAVSLVGAPTFPNSVKFSETNLLAVASGHLVTILDPAALSGPRGFIPITTSPLFDIGNVPQEGLQAGSLLPYILFRDPRPSVRSMDWSPSGLAQNGGCLLAVSTTDNRVKVFREPFYDLQSDWVEVMDFSEMAYKYCVENEFRDCELVSAQIAMQDESMPPPSDWGFPGKRKHVEEHKKVDEPQHRKMQRKNYGSMTKTVGERDLAEAIESQQMLPYNAAQPRESAYNRLIAWGREGCSQELALVLASAPESAASAMLEENAGERQLIANSMSDAPNMEAVVTVGEPLAAANSGNREKEAVSMVEDDDLRQSLANSLTKSRVSMKVHARNRAANARSLAAASGRPPASVKPDAHTCQVVNTSARPARMKKVPARFEDPSAVLYMNDDREMQFAGDVDRVEPVQSSNGVVTDYLPTSLKHGRRLDTNGRDSKINVAADYVARTELLSPLGVAWSPKCQAAAERVDVNQSKVNKTRSFAILGAGTKSGRVGIWRIMIPPCYSIDRVHNDHLDASFLGFLDAHKSWVTSLCWAGCDFDLSRVNMVSPNNCVPVSTEKLLLVTGCADGSVKIWAAHSDSLSTATSKQSLPISFCKQVGRADSVPVTALALVVLSQLSGRGRALLAVGKSSGSMVVYEIQSSGICQQLCNEETAHQQTVMGLSWRFDGRCLYSCGQDSLKIWELLKGDLKHVKLPDWSDVFPIINSPDLCSPDAMQSFLGVSLSQNCMALVTVRDLDSDALDQMYQARSQRAVLQMFWLGNKFTDVGEDVGFVDIPKRMTRDEIMSWKVNIVSALRQLEDPRKPLVLWDVTAVVSLLKEAEGGDVVLKIVSEWLRGWNRGEDAVVAFEDAENPSTHLLNVVSEASCRQLHILNVFYRRVLLLHLKPEVINTCVSEDESSAETDSSTVTGDDKWWRKCIMVVEHELRQRLVHCRLCLAIRKDERSEQEEDNGFTNVLLNAKWVLENSSSVSPVLRKVATRLRESHHLFEDSLESCPLCDSPVTLRSPDTASCQGGGPGAGDNSHHLQRCCVSMQVCPPGCQWYCSCCQRRLIEQAPSLFFSLSSRSQLLKLTAHASVGNDTYPGCPYCGVLMRRVVPSFFLTPTLI